jgi:WS/DGAT/MGAT family acyltransferase
MTETLTPLDATFLELEQEDEAAHMHIGGALVFDPRPDGSIPTLEELSDLLDRRLGDLPRYRCHLSEPQTKGLRWPEWQEDPGFEMATHVRHASLPAPGGEPELCEWLGDYWSHRLDRHRPLWEAVLLDGFEGGRWAIVTKTHHAMVDGVGSVDLSYVMLDTKPDGRPDNEKAAKPARGAPAPDATHRSRSSQLAGALRWAPEHAVRAVRAGADVALHPAKAAELLERSRATAELLVRDELIAAPRSSINCPIGSTRSFEVVRMPLAETKAIRAKLGGTVNDVVLAAVTGGLRKMLRARGDELPSQGLRAMVPVNVRDVSESLALGNRITSLFVHLPVSAPDVKTRYERTVAEAEALKDGTQAIGTSTIIDLAGLAPPLLHSTIARSLYATRLFNVTVTNVPGPQVPLYALGARLREVLPLVPLAADHALGVAIFSYDGNLFFGINAAADAVPDLVVLRDGISEEIDDLLELAGTVQPA